MSKSFGPVGGKTTSSLLDNTASIGSHASTDICDVAVIVALVVIRALAAAPAPAYALASAPVPAPRTALAPAHASASGLSPAPDAATPLTVACSRCTRVRVSLPWMADWRSGKGVRQDAFKASESNCCSITLAQFSWFHWIPLNFLAPVWVSSDPL